MRQMDKAIQSGKKTSVCRVKKKRGRLRDFKQRVFSCNSTLSVRTKPDEPSSSVGSLELDYSDATGMNSNAYRAIQQALLPRPSLNSLTLTVEAIKNGNKKR
jgi:hypothetical protein